MPTIYSYGPSAALTWAKQGKQYAFKQLLPLLLLFLVASTLSSMLTVLPLVGFILGLIFMPLSHMIMFNAAYGIRLRGYFIGSDIFQKLRQFHTWKRLIIAALLNIIILYIILSITLPELPLPAETLFSLSQEEFIQTLEEFLTLSNFFMPFFCMAVYMMISFWIYPLITWENIGTLKAFILSFKASLSNAIALSILMMFYMGVVALMIFILQTLLATLPDIFFVLTFFVFNIIALCFYMSLFSAYMEIFYGKEDTSRAT